MNTTLVSQKSQISIYFLQICNIAVKNYNSQNKEIHISLTVKKENIWKLSN